MPVEGGVNFRLTEVVHDDSRVLSIAGDFDLSVADGAAHALAVASADPQRVLVVDLTACTFLDSTAIAAIVGAARALTNGQIRIAIACTPGSEVRDMLALTGIDRTIPVLPTVSAAVAAALADD